MQRGNKSHRHFRVTKQPVLQPNDMKVSNGLQELYALRKIK